MMDVSRGLRQKWHLTGCVAECFTSNVWNSESAAVGGFSRFPYMPRIRKRVSRSDFNFSSMLFEGISLLAASSKTRRVIAYASSSRC